MASIPFPAPQTEISQRAIDWLRAGYLGLCLAFVSYALWILLRMDATQAAGLEDRASGTPIFQVASIALFSPALLLVGLRLPRMARVAARGWPLLLLLGWAGFSIIWSVEPAATARRVAALYLGFPLMLYAAVAMPPQRYLRIAAITALILVVLSILAVAVPGVGINAKGSHVGAMQGIFPTKNYFGLFLGLAGLIFGINVIAGRRSPQERLLWLAMMPVTLILLWFSNARTPLLALLVALSATWAAAFVFLPRGWQRRLTPGLRAGAIVSAGLAGLASIPLLVIPALALLGRDITLSGRLNLWTYAVDIGQQRPWLGAGFKAFWTDSLTLTISVLHEHWMPGDGAQKMTANAHNGYLDIWLDLGMIGLAIFMMFWIAYLVRACRTLAVTKNPIYLWHITLWAFMSVYYLTNSLIMQHAEIGWFLLCYGFLSLAVNEVDRRGAVARGPSQNAARTPI